MALGAVDKHNEQVYTYKIKYHCYIAYFAYAAKLDCQKQSLVVGLFQVPATAF